MESIKNECTACKNPFEWHTEVIIVGDEIYHKDCVNLYPTGYVAYIGDEFLGETENDDGSMACDYIESLLDED